MDQAMDLQWLEDKDLSPSLPLSWNPGNWAFPTWNTGKITSAYQLYCCLGFIETIAKKDCLILGIHWICSLLASLEMGEG